MKKHAFLITATSSGCGKTTLSLGLMRSLKRKGFKVQPFKCGPDYIDTQYHKLATGKDSINLDLFMSSESHVKNLFQSHIQNADIGIVEGVMGMFDGFDKMQGSSADIAGRLNLPIILLVNASSTAYSVVASIYGFSHFRKNLNVIGVIFNRVASENHYSYLQAACNDIGIPSFGYLSKNDSLVVPSRHLGLNLDSKSEIETFIDKAADEVEKNINSDAILSLSQIDVEPNKSKSSNKIDKVVAVAYDEAFNFIYPANLEAFNAEIIWFSPLHDQTVPDADLIYLPGGYPELFTTELENNYDMRQSIRNFVENNGKILAECGGMIYLTEDIDGKKMCGVLPISSTMENAKLTLGYRKINFPNLSLKGHEFHYSKVTNHSALKSVAVQFNVRGNVVSTPVYRYKNAIAGYTHLYWGESDIFKLWDYE